MLTEIITSLVMQAALCQNTCALPPQNFPYVEQTVECISIAHLPDGAELVFFWDVVQGEWVCLDHRWLGSNMVVRPEDGLWRLDWDDESENCHRCIRTKCWVESREYENPLSDQNQRPWFRQLLNPGLKSPNLAKH